MRLLKTRYSKVCSRFSALYRLMEISAAVTFVLILLHPSEQKRSLCFLFLSSCSLLTVCLATRPTLGYIHERRLASKLSTWCLNVLFAAKLSLCKSFFSEVAQCETFMEKSARISWNHKLWTDGTKGETQLGFSGTVQLWFTY